MTTRESIAVILAVAAFAVVWRGFDELHGAFTSPTTAPVMWALVGVGIALACVTVATLGAALVIGMISVQDGVGLAVLHLFRGRERVIDIIPNASPLDGARTRKALADAALQEEKALDAAERRAAKDTPDWGPGEFVSNGHSGVDWPTTAPMWERKE